MSAQQVPHYCGNCPIFALLIADCLLLRTFTSSGLELYFLLTNVVVSATSMQSCAANVVTQSGSKCMNSKELPTINHKWKSPTTLSGYTSTTILGSAVATGSQEGLCPLKTACVSLFLTNSMAFPRIGYSKGT